MKCAGDHIFMFTGEASEEEEDVIIHIFNRT